MSSVKRIGLIGFGAIGQSIAQHLQSTQMNGIAIVGACVRPHQVAAVKRLLPPSSIVTENIDQLLACGPDLMVEAAGQGAVVEYSERILAAGVDLFILSLGALADPEIRNRLDAAARRNGAGLMVPAGALGGFDGLRSMRLSGLVSVTYTSTKPPVAWRGTPAEKQFSLLDIQESTVLFRGSAAEAALNYPKNANLAAAVAIAGMGFEDTLVELIADPKAVSNTGRLLARSPTATLDLSLSSTSFEDNPKTSEITSLSVISAIENQISHLRFV